MMFEILYFRLYNKFYKKLFEIDVFYISVESWAGSLLRFSLVYNEIGAKWIWHLDFLWLGELVKKMKKRFEIKAMKKRSLK